MSLKHSEKPVFTVTKYKHTRKKDREMKLPAFYCVSCAKRNGRTCSFYSRPIELYYNKCFYHSSYSPHTTAFKSNENLEEIILKEEQERLSA